MDKQFRHATSIYQPVSICCQQMLTSCEPCCIMCCVCNCRWATLMTACLVLLTSLSTWCTWAAPPTLMTRSTKPSWQHTAAAATHPQVTTACRAFLAQIFQDLVATWLHLAAHASHCWTLATWPDHPDTQQMLCVPQRQQQSSATPPPFCNCCPRPTLWHHLPAHS